MANLTENVELLADKTVEIHSILNRMVERQANLYEIVGYQSLIIDQLEDAVGPNPNNASLASLRDKILAITEGSEAAEQELQAKINKAMEFEKGWLKDMADTPFDQPAGQALTP